LKYFGDYLWNMKELTSPQAEWTRNHISIPANVKDCSLLHSFQIGSGVNISTGLKRSKRDANHSLQYNVEIKNAWNYTSSLQYSL
jgi:hypothetical protein